MPGQVNIFYLYLRSRSVGDICYQSSPSATAFRRSTNCSPHYDDFRSLANCESSALRTPLTVSFPWIMLSKSAPSSTASCSSMAGAIAAQDVAVK